MENEKDTQQQPPIFDQLKEYTETRLKLLKYEAIDRSTSIISSVAIDLMVVVCFILAFFFLSFALAFYISVLFFSKDYYFGFGCVAVLYVIAALIINWQRAKIQKPIVNILVKKLFK